VTPCIVVGCAAPATETLLAGGKPAWCAPHLAEMLALPRGETVAAERGRAL